MAVTVLAKKKLIIAVGGVKTTAQRITALGQLQEEAEEIKRQIAELQLQLQPLAAAQEEMSDWIEAHYADAPADSEDVIKSSEFLLRIKAKGKKREVVDKAAIRKAVGAETFMDLVQFRLGDLDKYLTPPQLEKAVKTERTKRTFSIERKHPDA